MHTIFKLQKAKSDKANLFFAFFLFFQTLGTAQLVTPQIIQQHIYGGSAAERIYTIQQTSDGGFIAVGNTNSYLNDGDIRDSARFIASGNFVDNNSDLWVIKLDAKFNIQWQRVFGGNGFDAGLAIKQLPSGAYIIAGYLASSGGDTSGVHASHNVGTSKDGVVVKLNANGTTAWKKVMGGGGDDVFEKIQLMPDGGFLLCGITNSNDGDIPTMAYHDTPYDNNFGDAWLVKLDSMGVLVWQRVIGGENKDSFTGMDKTADGNYILGGFTNSTTGDLTGIQIGYDRKAWILKISPTGTILWQKVAFKALNIETRPYSILTSASGDYYLGGISVQNYSSVFDYCVIKFSSAGDFKWLKTYGGSADDWARSLTRSVFDDGVFISGYTLTNNDGDITGWHGEHDAWIVHCDTSGNIVQKICVGGTDYDYFWNSCSTWDGRPIFAGYSKSTNGDLAGITKRGDLDAWIVELNWGYSVTLTAKVILEGAYNSTTGLMSDSLRKLSSFPLTSPYGTGEVINPCVLIMTGNAAVVDWIKVELRDKTDSSKVKKTRSALLLRNGNIVDIDGVSTLFINNVLPDNYFVSISHRNHLAIRTLTPVALAQTPISLDFTNPLTPSYGNILTGTPTQIYSGDINSSGLIDATDRSATWNARNQTGYLDADCNLNGVVDANDRALTWNNRNKTKN